MSKKFNYILLNCILYILLCISLSYSQGTWTQKANVFTTPRAGAVGFSIGNKGYIGTGWQFNSGNCFIDFWEWDQGTNTWSQKANFPDSARGEAVSFSIGTKGYIVTGYNGFTNVANNLWEWDQGTNIWSQKAMFPGGGRNSGAAFSIGLKGYVGCGYSILSDFWEYDQSTDTWTQVANIPVGRCTCVSFSIGSMGYVCLGIGLNDLWEFNPSVNSWTQKVNFPGGYRSVASGFSIGNKGYVGTGWDSTNATSDFWCYDPALNLWTQKANYPHAVTDIDRAGFSIGCKGYFGTGATTPHLNATYYNDFWEYEPDTCSLTGIEIPSTSSGSEFLISPNPFSETLNITLNSKEPVEIIIYDESGKKVVQKKITSAFSLDAKSFAKGIYIYEVKNKNGVLSKGKIVKNN